jgi:inhibitor of KinA sporulation pathway (predicted exonuclease)
MHEHVGRQWLAGEHRALRDAQITNRIVDLAEPQIDDAEATGDVGAGLVTRELVRGL